MKKAIAALTIGAALCATALLGCGPTQSANTSTQEAKTASAAYGEPWLTSIVDGMVTADLAKPDLKDDFFLNANYEWLRDTAIPADHTMTGGHSDVRDIVNEQVNSLFTDESITGPEAQMVREYYQMFLDWDSRAEGKAFFLEHHKPIQDATTRPPTSPGWTRPATGSSSGWKWSTTGQARPQTTNT